MLVDKPAFIRGMLQGLLFQCPLGGNPCDCPGHAIRKLPVRERVRWLQSLSDAECRELYLKHLQCLQAKWGASGAPSGLHPGGAEEVRRGGPRRGDVLSGQASKGGSHDLSPSVRGLGGGECEYLRVTLRGYPDEEE
jgi:hypothetical protein